MKNQRDGSNQISSILEYCEKKEDLLHRRLSVIINELWDVPGVRTELLTEIEDLYISKGAIYCSVAYEHGIKEGARNSKKSC
ncbi:oxidoreductase [Paenibacillus xylanexedens]|uniref:Uncharacterized protein n=1 Tax=Paenibacillus xylanexedens TaxID=528191 RepID=A0ABS4RWA0_PAEXY|nr:oxidoreductase [Paenibacillus xylanexedens]MBP2247183.1 hypothetical protein [Paenibacillus xylanexedens]